jgi:RinA family phage transcriptional activator
MRKRRKKRNDELTVEDYIQNYHYFRQELERERRNIILSTPIFDSNGGGKSNLPSRPTEKIVIELEKLTEKEKVKLRFLNAIVSAYLELPKFKQQFVTRLYWSGSKPSIYDVCQEFTISEPTYYRWKKDFIDRVDTLSNY